MSRNQRHSGFTLVEVLIAMAIFTILSLITYNTLNSAILASNQTSVASKKLANIQRILMLMQRDMIQMAPRPIIDEFDKVRGAFEILDTPAKGVEFTRGGYQNPARLKRSMLKRIAYEYKNDTLYRKTWDVLDRATQTEPAFEEPLLEGVNAFEVSVYNEGWQDKWPSQGSGSTATQGTPNMLPRAVKIEMDIEEYGKFSISIPGVGG